MRLRLAILSVGAGLLLMSGCSRTSSEASASGSAAFAAPNARASTTAPHGDLSSQEYDAAIELARQEIRHEKATVTSATATVGDGTVAQPNLSGHCDSGRLLKVTLIGTFPNIVTTGHPVPSASRPQDFAVHAVVLTADAGSAQACLLGVETGNPAPEPGAVVLDLG
jgi:hypothetical protein